MIQRTEPIFLFLHSYHACYFSWLQWLWKPSSRAFLLNKIMCGGRKEEEIRGSTYRQLVCETSIIFVAPFIYASILYPQSSIHHSLITHFPEQKKRDRDRKIHRRQVYHNSCTTALYLVCRLYHIISMITLTYRLENALRSTVRLSVHPSIRPYVAFSLTNFSRGK